MLMGVLSRNGFQNGLVPLPPDMDIGTRKHSWPLRFGLTLRPAFATVRN